MTFNTIHRVYDTEKFRVTAETQNAYNAICNNVHSLNGEHNHDYIVKFLNAVLVDTFGMGETPNGTVILKDNSLTERIMNHYGFTDCGRWFECNGEQAIRAVNKIYNNLPNDITNDYVDNIGKLFDETLRNTADNALETITKGG